MSWFGEPRRLYARATHRGLHGRAHIDNTRRVALLMASSGFARVCMWTLLLTLYLVHVAFARTLFASVSFVAVLSVLALMLTDWGQVAASLAQLAAAEAHSDAEHNRKALTTDTQLIEADIARLADLQPGPEAQRLAAEIRGRL